MLRYRYDQAHEKQLEATVNGRPNRPTYLFEAPLMVKGNGGTLRVGETVLEGPEGESLWLFADPARHHYALLKTTDSASPLRLRTPDGIVSLDGLPLGRMEFKLGEKPTIAIDTLAPPKAVRTEGIAGAVSIMVNGRPYGD